MAAETITPQMVSELRRRTGAGIMDCKEALHEAAGEMERAIEVLRKKGIARSAKKAGRETKEGSIFSYIHGGGRIGVLIEVNCETDFVARTGDFGNLVKDLALQIAASSPHYVSRNDVSPEVLEKEKEIFMHQAKQSGKPDAVIAKMLEGQIEKFYQSSCLLEQPYIRDPKKKVEDCVKEVIGKLGENIAVQRFARFAIGEVGFVAEASS